MEGFEDEFISGWGKPVISIKATSVLPFGKINAIRFGHFFSFCCENH